MPGAVHSSDSHEADGGPRAPRTGDSAAGGGARGDAEQGVLDDQGRTVLAQVVMLSMGPSLDTSDQSWPGSQPAQGHNSSARAAESRGHSHGAADEGEALRIRGVGDEEEQGGPGGQSASAQSAHSAAGPQRDVEMSGRFAIPAGAEASLFRERLQSELAVIRQLVADGAAGVVGPVGGGAGKELEEALETMRLAIGKGSTDAAEPFAGRHEPDTAAPGTQGAFQSLAVAGPEQHQPSRAARTHALLSPPHSGSTLIFPSGLSAGDSPPAQSSAAGPDAVLPRRGGGGRGGGGGHKKGPLRPYPYAEAIRVVMADITDEGAPPLPRAGLLESSLTLQVLVQYAKFLPRLKDGSQRSHYMCVIALGDVTTLTEVKPGDASGGCVWNERFSIQVQDTHLKQAERAQQTGDNGPKIIVSICDCGRYAQNDVVGQVMVRLRDLTLTTTQEASGVHQSVEYAEPLRTSAGEAVKGMDGHVATLAIAFGKIRSRTNDDWKAPTLEESLAFAASLTVPASAPSGPSASFDILGDALAGKKEQPKPKVPPPTGIDIVLARLAGPPEVVRPSANASMDAVENAKLGMRKQSSIVDWTANMDQAEAGKRNPERQLTLVQRPYWREQLETTMDSLTINFFMMFLVLLDCTQLLVFTITSEGEDENVNQTIVTLFMLTIFFVELTLRQIAKGFRFWKSTWNWFDSLAVYGSIIFILVRVSRGLSNKVIDEDMTGVSILVISRVSRGMRIARVLINLRRARKLSGHVTHALRNRVSRNRRRYRKYGFDLDLTYITDKLISMSAPAFGGHSAYRNDIHVVSRFLSFSHYGNFAVLNMCDTYRSSDGMTGNYNQHMLFGQVVRVPVEDHGPPLLIEIMQICRAAAAYLSKDERNVLAVHCKGGKGRTGTAIACIMLYCGHRRSAADAIELFAFRRTKHYNAQSGLVGVWDANAPSFKKNPAQYQNQTVEGPSQIRYVHYLEAVLYSKVDPFYMKRVHIETLGLTVGQMQAKDLWELSVTISCMRTEMHSHGTEQVIKLKGEVGDIVEFPVNITVWGDVRVDMYRHQKKHGVSKRKKKLLFFCMFNTNFYPGKDSLVFEKWQLDNIAKDAKHEAVDENFLLQVNFAKDGGKATDLISSEIRMRELFRRYGKPSLYPKGHTLTWEGDALDKLVLVVSGELDGVIQEVKEEASLLHHPLGMCLESSVQEQEGGGGKLEPTGQRIPNLLIHGKDAILGASAFLRGASCPDVVAKGPCEMLEILREPNTHSREGLDKTHGEAEADGLTDVSSGFLIQGMSPQELHDFYRGLSITLATTYTRVQVETNRISECKAFNDTETVLKDKDETEMIRTCIIHMYKIPSSERVALLLKCSWGSSSYKTTKVRLVLLSNNIVLDPMYYGPEVSSKCTILPLRKLRGVNPSAQGSQGLVVTVLGEKVKGLDFAANFIEYEFEFHDSATALIVYNELSLMCKRAEETRVREMFRPLDSPSMVPVLQYCSKVHDLSKGQRLKTVSTSPGLFLVEKGEVRLVSQASEVFKIVREGNCFGAATFALKTLSTFFAEAATASTVLEIQHESLRSLVADDPMQGARFLFHLCQIIEKDMREMLQDTFPGTWTKAKQHEAAESEGPTPHSPASPDAEARPPDHGITRAPTVLRAEGAFDSRGFPVPLGRERTLKKVPSVRDRAGAMGAAQEGMAFVGRLLSRSLTSRGAAAGDASDHAARFSRRTEST